MSVLCDLALAIGITFGGLCQPQADDSVRLPEDDSGAWAIPNEPPPAPPAPAAPPPPMPPVTIVKTVEIPAPPPPAPPPPPPPAPKPDPWRAALEAHWQDRALAHAVWGHVDVPRSDSPPPALKKASLRLPPLAGLDPLSAPETPAPPADYEGERRTSTLPVDNARIVAADRYITGILETGINSQLDGGETGTVIIQTARDVFGYHGRNVLVPKGSRLICDYTPPADFGGTRLSISCKRILMGGHRAEILQLGAPAGDAQGRVGVTGDVDHRFQERYGTALLLTGISTAVRLGAATAQAFEATSNAGAVAERGAEELSQKFGEITASILERSLNLAPVITIPQGTRVQIRPAHDWYIREVSQ